MFISINVDGVIIFLRFHLYIRGGGPSKNWVIPLGFKLKKIDELMRL